MSRITKIFEKIENNLNSYIKLLLLFVSLLILSRSFELVLLLKKHYLDNLIKYQIYGFIYDTLILSLFAIIVFILIAFAGKIVRRTILVATYTSIIIFFLVNIICSIYFSFTLTPLDTLLYAYSAKEVKETVMASGISVIIVVGSITFIILYIATNIWLINKLKFGRKFKIIFVSMMVVGTILFFTVYPNKKTGNNFLTYNIITNKAYHFFAESINYFIALNKYNDNTLTKDEAIEYWETDTTKNFISTTYPMLYQNKLKDVVGDYFNKTDANPNIVIIIVEGLGNDYISRYNDLKPMPFLDSLKNHSLYWSNMFCLGARSYAAVPSVIGSLPYGKSGFTLLNDMPNHLSLVNILKNNGYANSFFYGNGAYFHNKSNFFNQNNIDLICDNSSFGSKYKKIIVPDVNFFWGYNDKDIMSRSIEIIDSLKKSPRMDIYYTVSMHPPYSIENRQYYESKINLKLNINKVDAKKLKFYKTYSKYFETMSFTDDAIGLLFNYYKKKKEFNNTIFIITGDHPMEEIPSSNSLKKYNVPLIIYSKLIKKPKHFLSFASQLDIMPTILGYLQHNYNIKVPDMIHCQGKEIGTSTKFGSNLSLPLMEGNRNIVEYIQNNYYYNNGLLFEIKNGLEIKPIKDENLADIIKRKLYIYNKVNNYVCYNQKLLPDSVYFAAVGYKSILNYTRSKVFSINENKQYETILEKIKIEKPIDNKIFVEYSLDLDDAKSVPPAQIIVELCNSKDSIIMWYVNDLTATNSSGNIKWKHINKHIIIEPNIKDNRYYIKAYFVNKAHRRLNIKQLSFKTHVLNQ